MNVETNLAKQKLPFMKPYRARDAKRLLFPGMPAMQRHPLVQARKAPLDFDRNETVKPKGVQFLWFIYRHKNRESKCKKQKAAAATQRRHTGLLIRNIATSTWVLADNYTWATQNAR